MEREYIVTLKAGVDCEQFCAEVEATTGSGPIPNRSVDVANRRPGSMRNTHYMLTDEEAATLRTDPRVMDVQIPPQDRTDIEIGLFAVQDSSQWTKSTSAGTTGDVNWGLLRGANRIDLWGGVATVSGQYPYTLTGAGVDVVIQDSGLDTGHIEFTDENGISRVQLIDWYAESGLPGAQSVNHYRDFDGHGTHCAGTVAGRTQGWAKNARIYALKVAGLEGVGDSGTGISINDCFDVIKLWHRNKPVDPKTGYKRPTVVNMSWGYGGTRSNDPTTGVHRGVGWNFATDYASSDLACYAAVGVVPPVPLSRRINVRVASVDADLEELIAEGVHVCIAAGNSYYHIAADGDADWNNTADFGLGQEFIMRGSSPYSTNAFMVGNMDITYQGGLEHKAESSCKGPGVDIYAPGTEIVSASSDDNAGSNTIANSVGTFNHPLDSNFKLMKISGTSMASPQVAGMIATVLEANPGMTPAAMKTFVHNNATTAALYEGAANDWDDDDSINGSANRVFYTPFNKVDPVKTNAVSISGNFSLRK